MRSKNQGQRKQSLNNRAAIQSIETTRVSHQKGLAQSTTMVQFESPKKINGQSKEFCHNSNLKRNLRSAMRNQSQGTMEEEQASKKKRYISKLPAMPLDEYIDKNKQQPEVEESEDKSIEENDEEQGVERDIQTIETTQVSHQKGLAQSTTMVQVESPKKINGQSKGFCHNNNLNRNLRSAIRNQSQETMEEEQASKKKRYIPTIPAMPLNEYIDKNKQQPEVEESEDKSIEENDEEQGFERDINYESEEVEKIIVNTSEGASSKRRRGRGKTLCATIHIRSSYDREEITLNEEGQPIGPSERIVSQFSSFLGTIARSSDLCPLIYTNWKAVPEKDKNIWGYVNEKYIVPEKGKKAVYAIINDAWRRYKCVIKKKHFSKYKNLHERLKNRPKDIPEEHFRQLIEYWRLEVIRERSLRNAQNTTHMKPRHRTGPISFARIRERMCASKEDREPPQAKMLIGTQQSKKGKEWGQETSDAVCASREDSEPSQAEMFNGTQESEKRKDLMQEKIDAVYASREDSEPSQAEMFIGTRQSEKGKDLVQETSDEVCASWEDSEPCQDEMFTGARQSEKGKDLVHETIDAVLQNLMVSSGQSSSEALQNVLVKEKSGSVACYGRTATAIPLKISEEILEIKRVHASELMQLKREHASKVKQLKREHASEVKQLKDQVQGMEEKFQLLVKTMLNQNNSGPNMEALTALLSIPSNAISALRSSPPTHAPNNHELMASKETPPFNTEILGKAKWDSISTKMLLHICMDEIRKTGKPGIAFKDTKWEEIRAEFQKRANKNYTQKQLKNRLENLRVDWTAWKQLMGDKTSLGYNHQIGTIEADAAWWDAKIRENAKYAKFRYQGLEFCDELEFIFGEIVATNQTQWTPAIGVPTEWGGKNIASDVPHEIIESDDELDPVENTQSRKKRKTPQAMSANHFNSDDELGPVENTQSRKKGKTPQAMSAKSTKGNKGKNVTTLVQAESENEVGKNEIAATSHANVDYSIPDCVKVLKGAKEAGLLTGREFSYALEMLRDDQTRELLISLKDSVDALVEWILYKYVSEGHLR